MCVKYNKCTLTELNIYMEEKALDKKKMYKHKKKTYRLTLFSIIVIPGRAILCNVHNPRCKLPIANICACRTSWNISMCSQSRAV